MDSRLIAFLLLFIVVLIGYMATLRRVRKEKAARDFAEEFILDLSDYLESEGADEDTYVSLTRRSNRMQNALGSQGVLAQYKPQNANYMTTNVPVVVNFLPLLHQYYGDEWLRGTLIAYETFSAIRDAILRYIGTVEERLSLLCQEMRNPFSQLRLGIEMLVMAPFDLLSSFGVLSASRNTKIHSSTWTRLFTGLISIITLASSIVTILVGWPVLNQMFR